MDFKKLSQLQRENREFVEDAKAHGINARLMGIKVMIKDSCELCKTRFDKEAVKNNKGGYRIPRYCANCVKERNIINENYAD